MVGKKGNDGSSSGYRFHVKNPLGVSTEWIYEERELPVLQTGMLLGRVVVAKIADFERLKVAIRGVPVVQDDPAWTCIRWVENALAAIEMEGRGCVGTCVLDWEVIRDTAKKYVEEKKAAHRYQDGEKWDITKCATYDLLERKEIIA